MQIQGSYNAENSVVDRRAMKVTNWMEKEVGKDANIEDSEGE